MPDNEKPTYEGVDRQNSTNDLAAHIRNLGEDAGMGIWGVDGYLVEIRSKLGLTAYDKLPLHNEPLENKPLEDKAIAVAIMSAFSIPYAKKVPASASDANVHEAFQRLQGLLFQFIETEYSGIKFKNIEELMSDISEGISLVLIDPKEIGELDKDDLIQLFTQKETVKARYGESRQVALKGLDEVYAKLPTDKKINPDIIHCILENNVFRGALPEGCFADFDTSQAIQFLNIAKEKSSNNSVFNFIEDFPHLHRDNDFRAYVLAEYPPQPALFNDDNNKNYELDIPEYKEALLQKLLGDDYDSAITNSDGDDLVNRNRELYKFPYVLNKYFFALKNPGSLTINPPIVMPPLVTMRGFGSGVSATKNEEGGFDFSLEKQKKFSSFRWIENSLSGLNLGQQENQQLINAGYLMDTDRAMLSWETEGDSGFLLLSNDHSRPGVVSICKAGGVEVLNMTEQDGPTGFQLRKPVIYLYPEKKQEIKVELEVKGGDIVVEYPKRKNGKWHVSATPNGELTDLFTKKKYSYLFWEAERKTPFEIDEKNCFCVSGEDSEKFLEGSLEKLGLNEKERNDFIVYWLPILERNPYNLISFLEEEYTEFAPLKITPNPDSLIRVFMIFKSIFKKQDTKTPKLNRRKREGFSVIEWGGMDLDSDSGYVK